MAFLAAKLAATLPPPVNGAASKDKTVTGSVTPASIFSIRPEKPEPPVSWKSGIESQMFAR